MTQGKCSVGPMLLTFNADDWCLDCEQHVEDVGPLEDGSCDNCRHPEQDDYDPYEEELLR